MMKRLLMTTAAASLLAISAGAYAQDNTGATGQSQQPPVVAPAPATNESGATTDMNNPASPPAADPATAPAPAAEAAPASPPPSDAVISAQGDGEVRADQIIGMTVYNAAGEKVGTVHDILLDKDGKATGVVLSVGGVLGVGAKAVGLTWKEIDVKPEQQQVQISYTEDQLKAAPDFKTTDQINAEMNIQQPAPTPAPAPATGGTSTNP
jgi:sporulation protein YlmC with PRC-barrel domain